MNKAWNILVVVLLIGSGYLHYQTQIQLGELKRQNLVVNKQLVVVGEQLAAVTSKLASFEEDSLDGMVRDANNVLLSGWESLVNTVGEELKKAREGAPQSSSKSPSNPPSSLDAQKLPDGTEEI